jgi:hypothetical protein
MRLKDIFKDSTFLGVVNEADHQSGYKIQQKKLKTNCSENHSFTHPSKDAKKDSHTFSMLSILRCTTAAPV